jgi:dTDP-4-amino-4,6-dideoxygalactose transaminase
MQGYEHGYQSYPCLFQPEQLVAESIKRVNTKRNEWMDSLQQVGISTRPATHAVHMLTYYREKYHLKPEDFPMAFAANDCSISLPLFHGMSEQEQQYVIESVLGYNS